MLQDILADLFGNVPVHHPILVLPLHGFRGIVGIMRWGAGA